jgi:tetratricopeptide (TPR) repeat protein
MQLNGKNPEVAVEFAGDMIDKLRVTNVVQDQMAWWMAISILRMARPPTDGPALGTTFGGSSQLKLNDEQRRELSELLADAALTASSDPNLVFGVTEVMAEIEQFAPDRAEKVKTKLAAANRNQTKEQREFGAFNTLAAKGTPEELIQAAAGASGALRDAFLQAAVSKAVTQGKASDLRESIKTTVEDQSQRSKLNDLLDEQEIGWAMSHGDLESLQRLVPAIRLKEKRAEALAQMALMLEKKGEHDEALTLLDQAQALVKINFQSQSQSDALLAVLMACALIDPPRAFAAIEPIVDRANDDIAKLLLLAKLIKSTMVKNGEIVFRQPGIVSPEFVIFRYGQGIAALAKADFNRTKALADRLQRNELRIMARLLMAQTLLNRREQTALLSGR